MIMETLFRYRGSGYSALSRTNRTKELPWEKIFNAVGRLSIQRGRGLWYILWLKALIMWSLLFVLDPACCLNCCCCCTDPWAKTLDQIILHISELFSPSIQRCTVKVWSQTHYKQRCSQLSHFKDTPYWSKSIAISKRCRGTDTKWGEQRPHTEY